MMGWGCPKQWEKAKVWESASWPTGLGCWVAPLPSNPLRPAAPLWSARSRRRPPPIRSPLKVSPEMANAKRSIFLVDDHPLVREWLSNLIHDQPDLAVCGEAESGPEALQAILAAKPDVAIV